MAENLVRATTYRVAGQSRFVRIHKEQIKSFVSDLVRKGASVPVWPRNRHFWTQNEEKMLDYLFILDSLNFCFWSPKRKWHTYYKGKWHSGYYGLALALKRFFTEHRREINLQYFAHIPFSVFASIFKGKGELFFIRKRCEIVRAVSSELLKKGGSKAFVKSARGLFSLLVPRIAALPSFNDVANYSGRKIYFWKRAQILACDIRGAFRNSGIGAFRDPNYLTAFPDYKLPQVLNAYGILTYAPELLEKLKRKKHIVPGGREEIEIRAATVWAVEYIVRELKEYGIAMCASDVDWLLWNKSQRVRLEIPNHRTKTIFY